MFVAIFKKISLIFSNIRLVALLLIADASCLMAIQKIVFFFRDGTQDVR